MAMNNVQPLTVGVVIAALVIGGAVSYHWKVEREQAVCFEMTRSLGPGGQLYVNDYLSGDKRAAKLLQPYETTYGKRFSDCVTWFNR
ncbi:hypothetical protein C0099_06620 [Pseudazoarcus pumilus]|uniref:Uncharacterized protein n=1 Tax=Pseudazoarcus pumilus TaxID=2067960 RepID=A0A2I6S5W3_9RHOO|nr:hypothetical protein C0099_06620 [Pseudazoarcus pumilus]